MTPPNGVASEAVSPTVARARPRGTGSMRSEAWRRFRKHRLASVRATILAVVGVAVVAGPFLYRVPIDQIRFRAKLNSATLGQQLRWKRFAEAARGLRPARLRRVIRHTLPTAVGRVIVAATIDVAAAILAESSLSFLGLGFPPDIPTWGRILFDAKDNLDFAPHWAIFPGTAIFLTVLSINYIAPGLPPPLDPPNSLPYPQLA